MNKEKDELEQHLAEVTQSVRWDVWSGTHISLHYVMC